MQIQGLQSTHATQSVQRAGQPSRPDAAQANAAAASTRPTDSLQLSAEAQQLSEAQATVQTQASSEARDANGIRTEKVSALRQAIADGSYDTPERMSAALDSLLDTFA